MNKGTVLTIEKKWAIIFTKDCQLIKIPLRPDITVGREIQINTTKADARFITQYRQLKPALIAATLVVLLAVSVLWGRGLIYQPVYAQMSIDVHSSLELALNRQMQVMSVAALNQETVQLMEGQNFKGLTWQEAVNRWTEILRANNQFQNQTMLISAVLPENAEKLKTQLLNMEGNYYQGPLTGVCVRVIYSNDPVVAKAAQQNGLSIGRQMLLNQAQVQNQNWNKSSIADAPLGELIQALLQKGEENQTHLTERVTQSLSEPSSPTESSQTNRETIRETNRQSSQDGTGTGTSKSTSKNTSTSSQQTNQGTSQTTSRETTRNGTSGTSTRSGSQQTSQYASQPSSQPGNNGTGSSSQQASKTMN